MRILLLSQFYPPETGAAQNRLSYLARWLASAGHTVTVLTAFPNYPVGRIYEGYRGRLLMEDDDRGVRIIRTWLYATKSKGFLRRVFSYCSFSTLALLAGIIKVGRQDVVIVESPPLPLGLTGFLISRLKRARFALNISDLWPESAVALGVLENRRLIQVATRLEEFLYRKADVITGQTKGIVASIRSRCVGKSVTLMPNGVDTAVFTTETHGSGVGQGIRESFDLNGHFVVGYAGLFGLAQGLDTVIDSAKLLAAFPDILIALIGDGPETARLKELAQAAGLRNIRFYPAQPAAWMPQVLGAFDVALVPLKRHALFKGAIPSKLFEAMGAALPVICSVDGEAREIIEKSRGGFFVEPENSNSMAQAVLELYRDPGLRKSLGENGRRYVADHYSRSKTAKQFEDLLLPAGSREQAAQVARAGA
jgi:glycosyltransferase involved in cell wall biosynthesis